jgi:hypothetical protein
VREVQVELPVPDCGVQAVPAHFKSQFPQKSVNLFFRLVIVMDKLTDLWGVNFCKTTLKTLCCPTAAFRKYQRASKRISQRVFVRSC